MSQPMAPAVCIHLAAALCALAVGIVQPVRAKGTPAHRLLGRARVAPMAVVAGWFTRVPGRLLGNLAWKGVWGRARITTTA